MLLDEEKYIQKKEIENGKTENRKNKWLKIDK